MSRARRILRLVRAAEALEPRRLFVAPTAAVDFYNVTEDQSLVIGPAQGVLANDFDPDPGAITAVLDDPPTHGVLSLQPDGSFTYTSDPDFFGNDGFTYHAFDGVSSSSVTGVGIGIDPAPDFGKISFAASAFQATEQTGYGIVSVVRTGGSDGTVSVSYSTSPVTASEVDDYFPASGVLTFSPGEVSKDILVGMVADNEAELSETLNITLSNPVGGAKFAGGMSPEATLTIVNSDPPPSIFFNDPEPVLEGDSGTTDIPFVLTLSEPSADPITVDFHFGFATATAGEDFDNSTAPDSGSGTLTFAPGETSWTLLVSVIGDEANEPDESFSINLHNPTNSLLEDSIAFAQIINDDNLNPIAASKTITREPGRGAIDIDMGSLISSPDSDALTLILSSAATAGTTQINNNGTPADASDDIVTWTPAGLGLADDSFNYEVADAFGGSAEGTITIQTRGASTTPNPLDPQKTDLVFVGADVVDSIRILRTKNRGEIRITTNGVDQGVFSPTGSIIISGGDGDDIIDARGLTNNIEVFGGAGDDLLRAGRGSDILVGGDGDDILRGGEKRDILVGGTGADKLVGGDNDDILIAGTTNFDNDSPESHATRANLLDAWTAKGGRDQRIDAIASATTENGVFLNSTNVIDDGAEDHLFGSDGVDWVFAVSDEPNGVRDRLKGEFWEDEFTELA